MGQSQPTAKCTLTQNLKAAGILLASDMEYASSTKCPSSRRQKVATFAVKHKENPEENYEEDLKYVLSSIEAFFYLTKDARDIYL